MGRGHRNRGLDGPPWGQTQRPEGPRKGPLTEANQHRRHERVALKKTRALAGDGDGVAGI